jgi:ABC-type nitrate/sulfonate/bicarbonate transport system substrate-binding protein
MIRIVLAAVSVALISGCALTPQHAPPPNDPVTLKVNVFRGSSNIPIYLAQENGYFARRGITIEMQFTPNSDAQRQGLAAGRFDIAHAAVDNAIAMVEVAKADVIIVAGGDGGMNELLVRPEINRPADIRGKSYVVDAPNTAYALIGRKIFREAGLREGVDYKLDPLGGSEARSNGLNVPERAATLLNPPWNFIARDKGAKSLGRTTDLFGPYQASGIFVMRPWAAKNGPALERYLAAYVEGCRVAQDPSQRELVLRVLQRELKLTQRIAELTYTELTTAGSGLAKDCAFDMKGFRNVLALRADIEGQWGGKPPAPDKYLDLSFYERARSHARP